MDMSSYQFVNTLAQCYEQAQMAGVGAAATPTAPQDYYNMQYPSCYSPATQQQYSQYSGMMGTTPAHSQDYPPPSSTSTSTPQPARRSGGVSPGGVASAAPPPPPNTNSSLPQNNIQSCKYADSNVGSPQDLSTTSSGGTPQPVPPSGAPKSPESDLEGDSQPTSPLSPSPGGVAPSSGGVARSATATSTSTKKEDEKSNPPQIYPWMKRVHLGQSK